MTLTTDYRDKSTLCHRSLLWSFSLLQAILTSRRYSVLHYHQWNSSTQQGRARLPIENSSGDNVNNLGRNSHRGIRSREECDLRSAGLWQKPNSWSVLLGGPTAAYPIRFKLGNGESLQAPRQAFTRDSYAACESFFRGCAYY